MDYTKSTIEELASNESFIDWVNQSDPEAVKYWDLYLATHPEVRDTAEKARILVLNIKQAERTGYDAAQLESMWRKIINAVESHAAQRSKVKLSRGVFVMASFLVLCVSVAAWFSRQEKNTLRSSHHYAYSDELPDFIERVNETDQPQKIELQDGSMVVLAARSSLKYKTDYRVDSTRSVFLQGEAFFEVAKNPYKPFILHSNELFVKVLGTSFWVSAPENKPNVVVSVKTGKVSVYTNKGDRDKKEGVILLPNQQVHYQREEQTFEKTLVEAPAILNSAIKETDFVFDNAPIAEVFKKIEGAYGIEIIYDEEIMESCYLTAPLGAEPMLQKLRIICETIGASYEVIDAKIVINSSGCW